MARVGKKSKILNSFFLTIISKPCLEVMPFVKSLVQIEIEIV